MQTDVQGHESSPGIIWKWEAGCLKINCDPSVDVGSGKVAVGCVARLEDGTFKGVLIDQ